MADFRWAYIGSGGIAKSTAMNIKKGNHKIVSVYSRTYSKAKEFAEKYGAEAFEDFENVLYMASAIRSEGVVPEQSWCEKAVYSAVQLALSRELPGESSKAQQLLSVYWQLGFDSNKENLEKLQYQVRERQKLLKKRSR